MNWKKYRRKAIRFMKKNGMLILLVCMFVFFLGLMLLSGTKPEAGSGYEDFLDALAMRESSDNYEKVNRYGYLGRYQMGRSALEDAGFRYEGGGWTPLANSYGIYDQNDFLNTPAAQDAAVRGYHRKVCEYILHYDLDRYIGTSYCGVTVTRSGLLAAAHLVGIGGIMEALETGEHSYDGNHVSAAEYMELFGGYDISEVWNQ